MGLVGNISSRFLVRRVYELFQQASQIPVESVWAPDLIFRDLRRSDQASYWDAGFPAVMVTDTAQFRYPHYHTPRDVPEHLDYETLQGVVEGLRYVIETLAR